jgi:hypothetical protein
MLVTDPPPRRRSLLALWHLLSLDAPSVAAVWTLFVARSVGLRLPWVEPAAMFVAVWMIYAADRLLDARSLDGRRPSSTEGPADRLEERHRFHHAHRSAFLAVIAVAALILLALLHRIDPRALHLYALLAALLGVWMLLIHARALSAQRLPKEIAVGLFFPAAVFIPTVAREPSLRLSLLPIAILFAGVCALNCLLLYAWEHPLDRSAAHGTTRWATRHPGALTLALLLAAGAEAAWQHGGAAIACAWSIALLWALDRLRSRMTAVHVRAAADLVLLTPLVWLLR